MKHKISLLFFIFFVFLHLSQTYGQQDSIGIIYSIAKKSKVINSKYGLYSGYTFMNMRHGYGTMKYNNGDIYKGYWIFNKKSGYGELTYENGDSYKGRWKKNYMNGYGKYTIGNKKYVGFWLKNELKEAFVGTKDSLENTLNKKEKKKLTAETEKIEKEEKIKTYPKENPIVIKQNTKIAEKKKEAVTVAIPKHTSARTPKKNSKQQLKSSKIDTIYGIPSIFTFGNKLIKYDGGHEYLGKMSFGKRKHFGKMKFYNGNIYEGNWNKDIKYGEGVLTTREKVVYKGRWNNKHGSGTIKYPNGDIYEGEWDTLRREGAAIMKYKNGDIFQGNFESDMRNGFGKYKYADTMLLSYEGMWHNNKKQGTGIEKYIDGRKFIGEFINGQRDGKGKIYNANGTLILEGKWTKGKRNVNPVNVVYVNGDKYQGFLNNYEGDLREKKKEGYGTMIYAKKDFFFSYMSGQMYAGNWHNNKKNGTGTHTYAVNVKYVGKWKDGKRHGRGTLYFADGSKLEGQWENDKYIGFIPSRNRGNTFNGYGITINGGTIHEGYFIKNKKSGYGKTFYPNGDIFEGNWLNGKTYGRYTIHKKHSTIEGTIRDGRDIIISKNGVYRSLDWALIEYQEVKKLDLSTRDTKNPGIEYLVKFKNLEELNVEIDRPLSELKVLFRLNSLKKLKITFKNNFDVDTIPSIVGQMGKLEVLILEGHNFRELPEEICYLQSLKILNVIGKNRDDSKLKLPRKIGNLKNLEELYIDGNSIKVLPKSIGELTSLKILSCKENLLKELPSTICNLENLKTINLFHNQINKLPKNFGRLKRLEYLDLAHNNIHSLPQSFGELGNKKNKTFDFRMNNISASLKNKISKQLDRVELKW